MAGIALVGSFGDKEIVRDHFLPSNVPTTEWRGSMSYQQSYYAQLPISGNANDLVASLPRELVKFVPAQQKNVQEIFLMERSFLAAYSKFQETEATLKAAREARQKEMDAALKNSREERAERKRAASAKRKKREDEQKGMIQELRNLTQAAEDKCKHLLQKCNWDISKAASAFYQASGGGSPRRMDITIVFTVKANGIRKNLAFKDSTTVFELYQAAFTMVPDRSSGFEMYLDDKRLLGEMEYSMTLQAIGLKNGAQHHIFIRQDARMR